MSKAQEIIRQMLENGNYEALASEENLKATLEAQGCTAEEIAETLGIVQSSVSNRLRRGREKLRKLLEGGEQDA